MKPVQPAAANSAGEGTLHAQTSHIITLATAGTLALDLWRAEQACSELREIYVRKIREYEGRYGAISGRINPRDPKYVGIISYTMDERATLTVARRKVHTARRRLRVACAKAARERAACA